MNPDLTGRLMKELDDIKGTTQKISEDVVDVRERVTRLETSSTTIKWLIGTLIAGTPVLFLVFDRLTR
jgi:ABC-type long-subunit fatty acid transport system fused permease/ATPase subunit